MRNFDVTKALEALEEHISGKMAHIKQLMRVKVPSDSAPDSLDKLYASAQSGAFNVWSGASDKTIFSYPSDNYAYRAYHDFYHMLFNCETTPEGERELWYAMLANGLLDDMSSEARILLFTEHMGQVEYYQEHGDFPKNQVIFMLQELLKCGLTPVNVPSHWWVKVGVCRNTITGETLTETALLQVVKGMKNV